MSVFSCLFESRFVVGFPDLYFGGVQTRARIHMWSFSLQAKTSLIVVHLRDLWVWSRSRFSESIKQWHGVLEREAEDLNGISVRLMAFGRGLCGRGSAACHSPPPTSVSPHQ